MVVVVVVVIVVMVVVVVVVAVMLLTSFVQDVLLSHVDDDAFWRGVEMV